MATTHCGSDRRVLHCHGHSDDCSRLVLTGGIPIDILAMDGTIPDVVIDGLGYWFTPLAEAAPVDPMDAEAHLYWPNDDMEDAA